MTMDKKEVLRERLRLVEEALKAVPGVMVVDIRNTLDGKLSVNKKGELRLPVTLAAEQMLNDPRDAAGVLRGNWKVVPVLVLINSDDPL